jgi:Flp pilus assembly secretin CpaC
MFKAITHLFVPATIALALGIPSTSYSQDAGGNPVIATGNNLQVQRGIERSVFEVLTNSAVAVESDETFSEISIANPDIADIYMLTDKSIYVIGKQPGRTTLMLLGAGGSVITVADVIVKPDISEFKQRLEQLLPDEDIQAFTANDGIVLTGTIGSAEHMEKALELATRYTPGRISNLMTLSISGPEIDVVGIRKRLTDVLPGELIDVQVVNGGVVLSGSVSTKNDIEQAVKLAGQFAPGNVSSLLTSNEVPEAPELPDAAALSAQLQEILPDESIELHAIGNTIVLSGTATSAVRITQAIELLGIFSPDAEIKNLVSVQEAAACSVRTRRGGEIFEIPVPCDN